MCTVVRDEKEKLKFRYTEIAIANGCKGVVIKACVACAGDSPKTPEAGQELLIPPCVWVCTSSTQACK